MSIQSSIVVKTYNHLPDVFEADRDLTAFGRDIAVDALLQVIRTHSLDSSVGLRLLHKHNLIGEGELMVEDAVVDDNGFALITRASSASEECSGIVPNSWVLTDAGFIPMEYSNDTLIQDSTICPKTRPEFFAELATVLRKLGLSGLIGAALLSSDIVEANRPDGATVMLELSALDDRANVLRFVSIEDVPLNSTIETFWRSNSDSEKPNKLAESAPATPQPQRVCTRICPSVQNPPVHQGTFIHQSKP